MSAPAAERVANQETQALQTVEVSAEDRPKLWRLICEKAWSGRYLGKNCFVLTESQILEARGAGLSFRTL
jgi:hypothetical protein